jgi:hypothetical protein
MIRQVIVGGMNEHDVRSGAPDRIQKGGARGPIVE